MPLSTLSELRSNILSTTKETTPTALVDAYLNVTNQEIGQFASWTWLRRKTTFATVASTESYNLDEEVDRIVLVRERTTRRKLAYLPDYLFYKFVPNPEDVGTGNPDYYRLWEETGFSVQPTQAELVQVLSSSATDVDPKTIVLEGRESTNNLRVSEILALNGTTARTSTTIYAIGGLIRVSKSATTTGTLTVRGATSLTTFATIAPEELAPRNKRLSLYPIPSSALTLYLEYLERVRWMVNDADVPQMDTKWNWVLREGALAKMWSYKQNEVESAACQRRYELGLRQMREEDERNLDYVPVLQPRQWGFATIRRTADSVNDNFPSYSLVV